MDKADCMIELTIQVWSKLLKSTTCSRGCVGEDRWSFYFTRVRSLTGIRFKCLFLVDASFVHARSLILALHVSKVPAKPEGSRQTCHCCYEDNLMLFLLVASLQFVVAPYSLAAALMMLGHALFVCVEVKISLNKRFRSFECKMSILDITSRGQSNHVGGSIIFVRTLIFLEIICHLTTPHNAGNTLVWS